MTTLRWAIVVATVGVVSAGVAIGCGTAAAALFASGGLFGEGAAGVGGVPLPDTGQDTGGTGTDEDGGRQGLGGGGGTGGVGGEEFNLLIVNDTDFEICVQVLGDVSTSVAEAVLLADFPDPLLTVTVADEELTSVVVDAGDSTVIQVPCVLFDTIMQDDQEVDVFQGFLGTAVVVVDNTEDFVCGALQSFLGLRRDRTFFCGGDTIVFVRDLDGNFIPELSL